jgi:hypothetical protein
VVRGCNARFLKDRAMRMIAALVALATPGLAFAADPNPKATLTCELVDEGRRTKLPAKRVRLEAPVECKLSDPGAARPGALRGAPRHHLDRLRRRRQSGAEKIRAPHRQVNGGAPWTATLAPDQDFVGCIDFVIEAVLIAPGADAKPAWSKKMKVKQYCPD